MRDRVDRIATVIEERPRPFGIGLIATVVALLYVLFIGLPFGSTPGNVRAAFDTSTAIAGPYQLGTARPLVEGAAVRVNGVTVGDVTKSELADGGRETILTMNIHGVTVHADARAKIAYRTLLGGNLQVQLDPGSRSAPELGDGIIPSSRTSDQVTVDDAFSPLQSPQRDAARQMFKGLQATAADPSSLGTTIDTLGPASKTLAEGLPPLRGSQPGNLARLVKSGSGVTAPLARRAGQLSLLVRHAQRTLAVTDARRRDLGTAFATMPAMLRATDQSVAQIDPTLDSLDPLATRLRPGARRLASAASAARGTLRVADMLLRDARPLLQDTGPTFRSLRRAANTGVPLIAALNPTVERLNEDLLPFLDKKDPESKLRVVEAIGPFFGAAASAASSFDDDGFFFYFPDQPDINSLGANPCSVDFTAAEKVQCESVVDVLGRLFPSTRSKRK